MQRQDQLPPEFSPIAHLVSYVVKRTHNEFSSSCPKCGGTIHKNGEFPDRFRLWRVSKYGKPMAWCRNCGFVWTPDNDRKPTREEIELWRQEQIVVEQARKEAAERALELLNNEKVWEKFYAENNVYSRNLLRERGLADSWIDYLKLGLVCDYTVRTRENGDWEHYHSPAISHPVWGVGGIVQNVKLRVTNPRTSADRYRNWYETGQSYLYVPLYDLPLVGKGVVVEGEFKADIVEQTLDDPSYRVTGIQSKSPSEEVLEQLKDLDPVYIIPDPDCFNVGYDAKGKRLETAVERLVRLIGKERSMIVQVPEKVDDGIVNHNLDIKSYINNARKAR
jgi:hypothetical protein